MTIDEAVRRAVLDDLRHPLWADALDHELADRHGTTPAIVRQLRVELRRDLELAALVVRVRELHERLEYPGTLAELLVDALECYRAAANRARRTTRMRALRAGLRAARLERELEGIEPAAKRRAVAG